METALRLRYQLLPYIYTLFAQHAQDGSLVMRPMWWEFPNETDLGDIAWWREADTRAAYAEAVAAKEEIGRARAAEKWPVAGCG